MKKIFNNANYNNAKIQDNGQEKSAFIGKTYQLNKHNLYVEDVIAEGGFSIVFLVKSLNNPSNRYALKRMYVNNDIDLNVCKREIQIIKSLSEHKNILKYIDSSITKLNDDVYEILLLTKYCKSGHLVQLMNENINTGFQEYDILTMFCDICEAISQLHKLGIMHRDIKVENILIDDTNNARNYVLCDFGSATNRVMDTKTMNVQAIIDEIQRYTTLSYRSPEMIDLYSNKPITTKSDIWALGCLLYKLCYFHVPFGESSLAIQEGRFTIPDNSKYSKQLNSLIKYMLEPDPTKRPDIYQVSYIAFSLANKQCPVKNYENSSIPNVSQLPLPMTESEWRKHQSQKTTISSTKQQTDASPNSSGTSVNPRTRPKGHMLSNTVKLNLNTQFIQQQQQQPNQQSSILANTNSQNQYIAPTNNNQSIEQQPQQLINLNTNKISQDLGGNNSLFSTTSNHPFGFEDNFIAPIGNSNSNTPTEERAERRSNHRRSFSHTFISNELNATQQTVQINYADYQQHPQPTLRTTPLAADHQTNRSTSASPSTRIQLGPTTPVAIIPQTQNINSITATTTNNSINNNNISNNSNNPFGDNFSQINDNDLFGIEFDRIRKQREGSQTKDYDNEDDNDYDDYECNDDNYKLKSYENPTTTTINNNNNDDNYDLDNDSDSEKDDENDDYGYNNVNELQDQMANLTTTITNDDDDDDDDDGFNENDPFRKAPIKLVSNTTPLSAQSSASSSLTASSNSLKLIGAGNIEAHKASAFQPYVRPLQQQQPQQPDPFSNAPFEITKVNESTPKSNRTNKPTHENPFVNAPFTNKKTRNNQFEYCQFKNKEINNNNNKKKSSKQYSVDGKKQSTTTKSLFINDNSLTPTLQSATIVTTTTPHLLTTSQSLNSITSNAIVNASTTTLTQPQLYSNTSNTSPLHCSGTLSNANILPSALATASSLSTGNSSTTTSSSNSSTNTLLNVPTLSSCTSSVTSLMNNNDEQQQQQTPQQQKLALTMSLPLNTTNSATISTTSASAFSKPTHHTLPKCKSIETTNELVEQQKQTTFETNNNNDITNKNSNNTTTKQTFKTTALTNNFKCNIITNTSTIQTNFQTYNKQQPLQLNNDITQFTSKLDDINDQQRIQTKTQQLKTNSSTTTTTTKNKGIPNMSFDDY